MLKVDGNRISYQLSRLEKIGACGGSPSANVANLVSYSREENPWGREILRGIRAPGTGIPSVIMLGTMRHRKGKDFCVIYKKNPVLVLDFKDEKFERWVIPATVANVEISKNLSGR
jgi:hypothetical protein